MPRTPSASINLGLSVTPDTDNQEIFAALMPLYNAIRNTMYAVDAYTGNNLVTQEEYSQVNAFGQLMVQKTAIVYVKLTEAVNAGAMINLWNSGGLRARKSVSATQRIHGYAVVSGAIGDTIPVCLFGLCTLVSGLTTGTEYYASTTPGLISSAVTSQRVGVALSSNLLWFTP